MMRTIAMMISSVWLLSGCANPSYLRRSDRFVPVNWSRLAVLPFSGDPQFREVATETFILHLLQQNAFTVVEPSTVEVAIQQVMVAGEFGENVGSVTVLQAQKIAEMVYADGVFIGTVTTYNNGMTFNGFATVRLIDAKTGQVVAASHKPSGLLLGWSVHQAVVAAVERTGKDMVKVLEDLAARNEILDVDRQTVGETKALLLKGGQDRPDL